VLQVAFSDCAGASTAWLTNTSTTISLIIQPRPQQVAILLDRSGSMSGDRWTNAVASARAIVRLFSTFRGGVHPGDRIGLLAFEDTGCAMGAGSVSLTPTLLPLNDPAAADAAICGVGLGNPGSCTPIGQGLVAAMDLLAGGGQAADTRYTVVLLTDGYENAGPVQVGPGIPPPGVVSFATARTATPGRSFVNQRLALFTVGLGSTVDEPVLNNLPGGAAGGGAYLKITDPRDLGTAFGQVMSFAQEANPLPTTATGTGTRFSTSAGAERLAVAVLTAVSGVQIGFRAAGSSILFTPGPAAESCPAINGLAVHAFSVPDVQALGLGGGSSGRSRPRRGRCRPRTCWRSRTCA